jgi:deoxyribonuclease V
VAFDVDYRADETVTACVGFDRWTDVEPKREHVHRSRGPVAEYVPGRFFERELPHIRAALEGFGRLPKVIVVDGHVWLAGNDPGLGVHLHAALDGRAAVVGVAKRPFHAATRAIDVLRGESAQALSVTAIGMDVAAAAEHVRSMHGAHRIPTLLKRTDRLCRDA